ncbi:MAG TPA: dienelactone hydrolase family protein [Vicinamibacterales bacterium]|nr:dienelactone hydrolase family protein [Vicinamibacterales bacterium]
MRNSVVVAVVLTGIAFVSSPWRGSAQTVGRGAQSRPLVSEVDPPAGTDNLAVQWLRISDPDLGVLLAAVARPSSPGPHPVVVVLHGTHGFAQEYVRWAQDLARGGFLAVAACWFSGGSGGGAQGVTLPIPCPQIPPLTRDAYPEAVRYIDVVVKAARALPDARADRLGLVGHSRGGGETLQYLLAVGGVQAVVLHAAGHGYRPVTRATEFNVPMLLLHGTADGPADGGGVNTQIALAREFEAALVRNRKPIEAHYYEGGGHNTYFTNAVQRDDELKKMIAFLRRHLGT